MLHPIQERGEGVFEGVPGRDGVTVGVPVKEAVPEPVIVPVPVGVREGEGVQLGVDPMEREGVGLFDTVGVEEGEGMDPMAYTFPPQEGKGACWYVVPAKRNPSGCRAKLAHMAPALLRVKLHSVAPVVALRPLMLGLLLLEQWETYKTPEASTKNHPLKEHPKLTVYKRVGGEGVDMFHTPTIPPSHPAIMSPAGPKEGRTDWPPVKAAVCQRIEPVAPSTHCTVKGTTQKPTQTLPSGLTEGPMLLGEAANGKLVHRSDPVAALYAFIRLLEAVTYTTVLLLDKAGVA